MALHVNFNTFRNFLKAEQWGSFLLILALTLSLIIANSAWGDSFKQLLETHIVPQILDFSIDKWINDGLMSVFFLLVGLEIKREVIEGELSSVKKAVLPIFAALGGMIFPALIYSMVNAGHPSSSGWGIPMATDIAFALAIISTLGKKVPTSLKVFLAALAIADDLGAILVIAVFYSTHLNFQYLLYAGGVMGFLLLLNRSGVKNLIFYLIPGLFLWYFIHHSGIHATIAGVLLAFTIPTNPVKETSSLEKLEGLLHAPVNYLIMPLFALANTNIRFEYTMVEGISSPLGIGIILGLFLGKPLGIGLFSWLAVKSGMSSLPSRSGWKHILGVSILGGIGFTMSIFISLLSFNNSLYQSQSKFAILIASLLAAITGFFYLTNVYKRNIRKGHIEPETEGLQ